MHFVVRWSVTALCIWGARIALRSAMLLPFVWSHLEAHGGSALQCGHQLLLPETPSRGGAVAATRLRNPREDPWGGSPTDLALWPCVSSRNSIVLLAHVIQILGNSGSLSKTHARLSIQVTSAVKGRRHCLFGEPCFEQPLDIAKAT